MIVDIIYRKNCIPKKNFKDFFFIIFWIIYTTFTSFSVANWELTSAADP